MTTIKAVFEIGEETQKKLLPLAREMYADRYECEPDKDDDLSEWIVNAYLQECFTDSWWSEAATITSGEES